MSDINSTKEERIWYIKTVIKFFSITVRIQTDRGQKVIQNGPYRVIRHPGYIGGILMGIGNALVLGSLWALIPAGIMAIMLIIRTSLEDLTLQKELPGYLEYTKKVVYRLIPGLW
jgi:protein-S-isoprenylcysteine O-methyltransferase Ste14